LYILREFYMIYTIDDFLLVFVRVWQFYFWSVLRSKFCLCCLKHSHIIINQLKDKKEGRLSHR